MSPRNLVIAAGGTGGHLFPAAAFAEEMRSRHWGVTLITDDRGRKYAKDFPADFIEDVPAATIQGLNPIKALRASFLIARGMAKARQRLAALKPSLVAGFGGYPSLPALGGAKLLGIPLLIHEQNAVLGRVNRRFAAAAALVACGFERLDKLPPGAAANKRVVGNPVRPPIRAVRDLPYPPTDGLLTLLIIGGSQGAKILSEIIPKAITSLPEPLLRRVRIVQQAREEQLETVRAHYAAASIPAECAPFFTNMPELYTQAHLVIARAGASSVTEIAVVGRPAIFIPLAIATDDHQAANADPLVAAGAADLLREADFTVERLSALFAQRLADPADLAARAQIARNLGHPEAAKSLADLAESIAK